MRHLKIKDHDYWYEFRKPKIGDWCLTSEDYEDPFFGMYLYNETHGQPSKKGYVIIATNNPEIFITPQELLEVRLSDDKILKYYEKGAADSIQLMNEYSREVDERYLTALQSESPDNLDRYKGIHFNKGRRVFLEVVVEDSLSTSKLFGWLNGKSTFDKGELVIMGCKLDTIHFKAPNLSDEAIVAIDVLKKESDKLRGGTN